MYMYATNELQVFTGTHTYMYIVLKAASIHSQIYRV